MIWILLTIFLTTLMSVLSRLAGGGLFAPKLPAWLPEILFGAAIGFAAGLLWDNGWAALLSWAWAYIWMQTGHGTVLQWGSRPEEAQGERKQFLTAPVHWIAKHLNLEIGGRAYCWLFMGLKGLLIGLPLFPFGLPLAILWPLSYEIGARIPKSDGLKEYLSGGAAGLLLGVALALT